MKNFSNLNQVGLNTPEKLVPFLAYQLLAGTLPSPAAVELKARVLKGSTRPASAPGVTPVVTPLPPADIPAVVSKTVAPNPAYAGCVSIDDSNSAYIKIVAALAYSPAAIASGLALSSSTIGEITAKGLDFGVYQGDVSAPDTNYPDLATKTVEQLFYEQVKLLAPVAGQTNKVTATTYRAISTSAPVPVLVVECFVGKSAATQAAV